MLHYQHLQKTACKLPGLHKINKKRKRLFNLFLSCYPTWIRTKTSRTRICGTTVILSGNKYKYKTNKKAEAHTSALLVAPPRFELRQTVPKTVVLPLYYRAILKWIAKIRIEGFAPKWILAPKSCEL
jgi:hypothetical protein